MPGLTLLAAARALVVAGWALQPARMCACIPALASILGQATFSVFFNSARLLQLLARMLVVSVRIVSLVAFDRLRLLRLVCCVTEATSHWTPPPIANLIPHLICECSSIGNLHHVCAGSPDETVSWQCNLHSTHRFASPFHQRV